MRGRQTTALLVWPVTALAVLWAWTGWTSRGGPTWEVGIQGYDPRDLLQGHYVRFTYDWPGVDPAGSNPAELCLIGQPPAIAVAELPQAGAAPCQNRVRAVAGSDLKTGRYYVDQTRADALTRQLADPLQAARLRFRIAADGRIVPVALTFTPRPAAPPPPVPAPAPGR